MWTNCAITFDDDWDYSKMNWMHKVYKICASFLLMEINYDRLWSFETEQVTKFWKFVQKRFITDGLIMTNGNYYWMGLVTKDAQFVQNWISVNRPW